MAIACFAFISVTFKTITSFSFLLKRLPLLNGGRKCRWFADTIAAFKFKKFIMHLIFHRTENKCKYTRMNILSYHFCSQDKECVHYAFTCMKSSIVLLHSHVKYVYIQRLIESWNHLIRRPWVAQKGLASSCLFLDCLQIDGK